MLPTVQREIVSRVIVPPGPTVSMSFCSSLLIAVISVPTSPANVLAVSESSTAPCLFAIFMHHLIISDSGSSSNSTARPSERRRFTKLFFESAAPFILISRIELSGIF